jgi:hypothetical protein
MRYFLNFINNVVVSVYFNNRTLGFTYGEVAGIVGFFIVYIYAIKLGEINLSLRLLMLLLFVNIIKNEYIEDFSLSVINEKSIEENLYSVIEESIYKFRSSSFALGGNVSREVIVKQMVNNKSFGSTGGDDN